jgi:hypothetical protein
VEWTYSFGFLGIIVHLGSFAGCCSTTSQSRTASRKPRRDGIEQKTYAMISSESLDLDSSLFGLTFLLISLTSSDEGRTHLTRAC